MNFSHLCSGHGTEFRSNAAGTAMQTDQKNFNEEE